MKPITLRIIHGNKTKVVDLEKSSEKQNKNTQSSRVSFGKILDEVNKFRLEHQINSFLDIFIKQKNNEWINIYQVVGNSQITKFQTQSDGNKQLIVIKLIEHNEEEEDQSIIFSKYHEKINMIGQKIQKIQQKVQKDVQKIQEDYTIDLAFFYAEPIVRVNGNLGLSAIQLKQVSFLLQIKKIFQKLNLLKDQKQQKKRPIRSAKIQIQVGTVQNIKKALSKGVKIMHFSCHGSVNNGLQLQTAQQNAGVAEYMNFETLKKILAHQKKSPEIIVYNACYSKKLAEETFELEVNGTKNIITSIGYQNEIDDWYCEKFSSDLYTKIFNGQNIQEFFENIYTNQYAQELKNFYIQRQCVKTATDLTDKHIFDKKAQKIVSLQKKKIKIFYDKKKRLKLTPSLVDELNPLIQVRNKLQAATINIRFDKYFLFQSMKKILNQKKAVIGLFGGRKYGKTCLLKKILEYLWQRGLINEYLSIQLKSPQHHIETNLQFECKLQQVLQNMNLLKINKERYFLLAIDDCDKILKHQQKQFQYILDRYERGLENKGLKAKFVFLSSNKGSRTNSQDIEINMPLLKIEKEMQNEKRQPMQRQQVLKFISICHKHITREIDKLPFKFIAEIPIISIFPKKMRWSQSLNHIDNIALVEECLKKTQHIEKRIQTLINSQLDEKWQLKKDQQQILEILKLMYFIIGVLFLQFYQLKILDQKEASKFMQNYQNMIQKLEQTTFKFLGVCFNIDQQTQLDEKIRYAFHILWIKLHFIIHYLKSLPNRSSNQIIEVVVQHISKIQQRQLFGINHEVSLNQILHLAEFNKKLCQQVLKNQKSTKLDFQLQDHQTNQILTIIQKMKNTLKNKFEEMRLRRKKTYPLENRMLNSQQIDDSWIERFQFSFQVYDENTINLALLPFFPMIKTHINHLTTKTNIQSQQIFKVKNLVEGYRFILTKNIKYDNNKTIDTNPQQKFALFANIFNYYREDFLDTLFQIQKIKFNNFLKEKKISRIQIINKLNELIKQCNDQKLERLKKVIEKYKRFEFNSFVALVTIPLSKPYRYEEQIVQLVQKTQEWFGEGMFPRIDALSQNTMSKYIQNDLFIPVALFVADTFTRAKRYSSNKAGSQTFFCLNTSGSYQQGDDASNIKNFSFFSCEIAIFCGKGVRQNIQKIKQNLKDKLSVIIFIDTIGFDQIDNKNKKAKKQEQQKQKQSTKDLINEIYEKTLQGMITQQMLTSFYKQFCQIMFLQKFTNYLDQVQKSFLIAKRFSEISCLKKFGASYNQKLNNVFEKVTYEVADRRLLKNSDPLRLNERKREQIKSKNLIDKSAADYEKSNHLSKETYKQIGFNKQLSSILQHIKKCIDSNQSIYLILECKSDEYKVVIKNLKIKLKIMGITLSLSYNNDTIQATGVSNANAYRQKVLGNQKKQGVQILLMDQLCLQRFNQIERLSNFIIRSEQRLSKQENKNKTIKIYIIAINQPFKKQQFLERRFKGAKIEFVALNKYQTNTFFSIECQKLINYRLLNPKLTKQSQNKYLWELSKYIDDGQISINQNKLNQLWNKYIDVRKS